MNLPLPIDATKEEVSTALEFYANATAIRSKILLEDMGSVLQKLPSLAVTLDRLISFASNIQQLASDNNIRTDRVVNRINCHLLCLIGAANDGNSPIKIEDYEELLDYVYNNACGILEACRHLA
jgi:hypothetical protein